jgi:hypothetical protein
LQRLLIRANLRHDDDSEEPADVTRIQGHIRQLKNGKAGDASGITAEHVKLAAPIVTDVVTILADRVLAEGKVPDSFKLGIITPVHKKEKPKDNPDSHRRITVTSIIGKIVEKELTLRINQVLKNSQSPYKFGFTEGVSSNNAALLLTEALAHAKTQRRPLYVTYMDVSKAFAVVDHIFMCRQAPI